MTREDMLAALMAQAIDNGTDLVSLRAIVEEASELGADRVMLRLGLDDDNALGDIDELRNLLEAWRVAKASAWKAAMNWLLRGAMALLLLGIAVRIGVPGMFK